jgi:preprotein translocase subunit SecG
VLFADVTWISFLLNIVVILVGLFLILLVLIQRGKGGGLAGAFGGVGGSSPFGSRAGDTFTRITIIVAAAWILLTMIQVKVIQYTGGTRTDTDSGLSTLPGEGPPNPSPNSNQPGP